MRDPRSERKRKRRSAAATATARNRADCPSTAPTAFPWWRSSRGLRRGRARSLFGPILAHDRRHDLLLARFLRRHFVDEAAFVHHIDAVTDAEQLGHLRGNDDDALAL